MSAMGTTQGNVIAESVTWDVIAEFVGTTEIRNSGHFVTSLSSSRRIARAALINPSQLFPLCSVPNSTDHNPLATHTIEHNIKECRRSPVREFPARFRRGPGEDGS
jgi:hypothetical protein